MPVLRAFEIHLHEGFHNLSLSPAVLVPHPLAIFRVTGKVGDFLVFNFLRNLGEQSKFLVRS
jgi:hypothetical protein